MSGTTVLKQNIEFHRAYSRGKTKASPALVTYAVKTKNPQCRIGITTSKKIGNAVERNRCRRIIRAAYRSLMKECNGGWDIVFVARFRTKQQKSTDIEAVMRKHLTEIGVISSD